jgi:malonyl-CoA/methylmalonyl-CoA synthetase
MRSRSKHVGRNILPNFLIFTRLVVYTSREESIVIKDITNGFSATQVQLLTDGLCWEAGKYQEVPGT